MNAGRDHHPNLRLARLGGVSLRAWAALLLVALGVRTLSALANPLIERDGATFMTLARQARESDPTAVLRHDQHPLFPALAALAYPLFGDWQATGLWISIIAGTLTVIPVVLLGNRACGPPAGLLGGWLFAAGRYPVRFTATALSDGVHGLLFTSAMVAGAAALGLGAPARAEGDGRGFGPRSSFFLAGFLSGAAYLARPEGLAAAVALAIAGLLKLAALRDGRSLRSLLLGGALLALGLVVSAGPYIAFLNVEYGGPRLTRKRQVFETLLTPESPPPPAASPSPSPGEKREPAPKPAPGEVPAPRAAVEKPDRPRAPTPPGPPAPAVPSSPAARRAMGIVLALRDFAECLGWTPLVLLPIGLLHRRRTGAPWLAEAFLFIPLILFAVLLSGVYTASGYVGRRHLYPPTIVLQGFVGVGLIAVAGLVARVRPGAPAFFRRPSALAAAAVLIMIPKSAGLIPDSGGDRDLWLREVGLALRKTVAHSDGIVCPGLLMRIGFYSGGKIHRLDGEPPGVDRLPELCAAARGLKARWVIVDRPIEAPLADPPPGFTLAGRFPHRENEVRLYRGPD
jgi:hypothetical protein